MHGIAGSVPRQKLLLIVLATTIMLVGGPDINGQTAAAQSPAVKAAQVGAPVPATSSMDALTAIFTRRSIRKYTGQPVSDETIDILLRAAMSAPSARNEQPWEFIVIRDRAVLQQFPQFHPFAKHVPDAPVAIVICGNTKLEAQAGLWALDCSNATMNILLAAHSMGLGAVWTTLYPYEQRMTGVKRLLNIPDHIIPLAVVPIGYPAEKKGWEDRFNPSRIHRDRW